MKLIMMKHNEAFKAFIVVNFGKQIEAFSEEDKQKVNIIVLNDVSVDELIHVLDRTRERSCQYYYVICIADHKVCIIELVKLLEFMNANHFRYLLEQQKIEMYLKELQRTSTDHSKE